jgi:hypothetical protein
MAASPGRYSVRFMAEAGKSYVLEVRPRGEQFAAPFFGGAVGLVADTAANPESCGPVQLALVSSN